MIRVVFLSTIRVSCIYLASEVFLWLIDSDAHIQSLIGFSILWGVLDEHYRKGPLAGHREG